MSNGTSLEDKAVTEKGVTNADLEAAQTIEEEKVVETKVEPEVVVKPPEEEPEEPTEHGERSKMGRRIKRTEDMLDRILTKLDSINYPTDRDTRRGREAVVEEEFSGGIPTPEEVRKISRADRRQEEREIQEEQGRYEQGYISTLNKIRPKNLDVKEEAEIHEATLDLMEKEWKLFGLRRSDYPNLDAELNYSKAKAAILSRKMASPKPIKPNVKGERPVVSTNLSVSSGSESQPSTGLPPLDEFAADFVKRTGMKEESVREALKGETPINLAKR